MPEPHNSAAREWLRPACLARRRITGIATPSVPAELMPEGAMPATFFGLAWALGFVAGAACGVGIAVGVQRGVLGDDHGTASGTALVGMMAGLTTADYAVGNAGDRRNTTIRIVH